MKIYSFDGRCYLRLADVHKMLSRETQKASDGRDHYANLTKDERIAVSCGISHLHSILNEDELACAETVNEHKRVIERSGQYGRVETPSEWAIIGIDQDDDFFYFRKWCKNVPEHEGEAMPIFSSEAEDAMSFASKFTAENIAEKISDDHEMFIRVVPRYFLEDDTLRLRLHGIYKYSDWEADRKREVELENEEDSETLTGKSD